MGVNPIDYPQQWAPTEFTCKCGTKCRVDVEFSRWAEVMAEKYRTRLLRELNRSVRGNRNSLNCC